MANEKSPFPNTVMPFSIARLESGLSAKDVTMPPRQLTISTLTSEDKLLVASIKLEYFEQYTLRTGCPNKVSILTYNRTHYFYLFKVQKITETNLNLKFLVIYLICSTLNSQIAKNQHFCLWYLSLLA